MADRIRNEQDLSAAKENLKSIYREIIRLVLQKEEFEEKIEEYMSRK